MAMNNTNYTHTVTINRIAIIQWCREKFGDTDPFTPYHERRWVSSTDAIHFRDSQDYMYFLLFWGT